MPRRSLRSSTVGSSQKEVLSGISKPKIPKPRSNAKMNGNSTHEHEVNETSQTKSATVSDSNSSDAAEEEVSGYEDEDLSAVSNSSAENDEEELDERDASGPARKKRKKASISKGHVSVKGHKLWRTGVKTGLGPGNQVIIARPKARPAGKIAYTDGSLHPNTMLFLSDLAKNNDREWLKSKFGLQQVWTGRLEALPTLLFLNMIPSIRIDG